MTYQYLATDVPTNRNFIDIEGPDGLLSYADVLELLHAHGVAAKDLVAQPAAPSSDEDVR